MDNDDLIFYSKWDIDQLESTDSLGVGATTTQIATLTDISNPNTVEVQFQPSGVGTWFMPGENLKTATLASVFTFYWWIDGTGLYVASSVAGTARWFIWSDKWNY